LEFEIWELVFVLTPAAAAAPNTEHECVLDDGEKPRRGDD
jgi:hypothetical protein